jgi:iron complex outermembrane receptor protein
MTNGGIDFALFKGDLSGTIDYFHKVSNNILLDECERHDHHQQRT